MKLSSRLSFPSLGLSLAAPLLAALFVAGPAGAQTLPTLDQRQANQERRIEQGEASGALTPREANRLEAGQAHVDRVEERSKADGVVSARERARLQHGENVQSRRIARQKHDRQRDVDHDGRIDRPVRAPRAG